MTRPGDYYDELETRPPERREAALFAALPAQLRRARQATGFARILADVDPDAVGDRKALARLPVTRKSRLIELQKAAPPFAGLNATAPGELGRIFVSPGPIFDPEGRRADYWRLARALYAAGFRRGDILHNCFAYHLTPAGSMLEMGAHALGCAVVPAGPGNTEQQVQAIVGLRPQGYVGTPSFLKIILDKAAELGADVSSLKRALVSAEALPASLRAELKGRGVATLQCYASADLGLIAYESPALEGMIVDEGIILEIVRPGTGDPVPEGEVGEVVVTTFNEDYPLVRFATGDLSAIMPGASPCGRTNARIKGWMGRADQTTKVKGMFVHPAQIAEALRRHPQVKKARLIVDRVNENDAMTLRCELQAADAALAQAIGETIHALCKLRGKIEFVPPGSLPNDGKVIEDVRNLS
ncbi:MAG: phenylacetate--CoA ligase family protein [Alphaproteobacteria bacterium]|nr:phenylacetate--CoA ligase family protein [Alphaproteobacteria bacterium]